MADSYYTLITALPWLPDFEECHQMPLSRIALDQRLTMLVDQDLQQLQLIESLYHLNADELAAITDKTLVSGWRERLENITSDTLKQRVLFQLELRTLLAAMRMRNAGLENPNLFHGLGRWLPRIRKHWFEPGFGLDDVYPALQKLQRVKAKENPLLMTKTINRMLWDDLVLCERQNHFSFEAVVCFVLRWGIAERAIQQDGAAALAIFNSSTEHLLADAGLAQQLGQGVSK